MDRPVVLRSAEGSRPGAFGPAEWGLLAGVALIWGSSFVLIAYALESFSPGLITFGRLCLGFLALALFPAARSPDQGLPHLSPRHPGPPPDSGTGHPNQPLQGKGRLGKYQSM